MTSRFNLVVPLNGRGQRMVDGGYILAKPLLRAGDKTIIEQGIDSIDIKNCQLIFITRADKPEVGRFIESKWPNAILIEATEETQGSLHTVLLAKKFINNETPLIVFNPDVAFFPKYIPCLSHFQDGTILTFKSNSPNYSYVKYTDMIVSETAEKDVISTDASVGLYTFRSGKDFCELASLAKPHPKNGEFYICPFYNQLIEKGWRIKAWPVEKMYVFGIPAELNFFNRHIAPSLQEKKKYVLANDHSGYFCIDQIKQYLSRTNHEFVHVGSYNDKNCDYNEYIKKAVQICLNNNYFGIISCLSGNGVQICANKADKDIICGMVSNLGDAIFAIEHNCSNMISIPAKLKLSDYDIGKIITVIDTHSFSGGRHQIRMMKSLGYE